MYMDLDKYVLVIWQQSLVFLKIIIKNKPLPVVRPGSQTRRFTHISDTIEICYHAWKKTNAGITQYQTKAFQFRSCQNVQNKNNVFTKRKGERYASALIQFSFSNKVYKNMEEYI